MAKQTKPKTKRTQVKDLSVEQQELTTDEAGKVKGGATPLLMFHTAKGRYLTSTTSSSTLSSTKK